MSKFATPERFEGTDGQGGTWYRPPPALSWEMWPDRVRVFRELTGLTPAAPRSDAGPKVLVAGCGYGYVCWHLWDQGFSAWGMDGAWAQGQARGGKLPNISDHIWSGDVTLTTDVRRVRGDSGIGGNRRFDAVITDDLLSVADSAAEAQSMLTVLRAEAAPNDRSRVVHFISMYDPTQPWSPTLTAGEAAEGLYRTEAEWIGMIGTSGTAANERIVNIHGGHRIVR